MKHYFMLAVLLYGTTVATSCSSDHDPVSSNPDQESPDDMHVVFAKDDGSKCLQGTPAQHVQQLLAKTGVKVADGIGKINITDAEKAEIKQFTDELVKGCKTEEETYHRIFKYLYNNIEYKHEYEGGDIISNDPYPVFTKKAAICQGFSNLQHIMLESQHIPTLNVNGMYVGVGGHAWNYVYHSGKWWVSDATNNGSFSMDNVESYKHLEPASIEATIFETDDYGFTYYDYALNIDQIKRKEQQLVVPFSVAGIQVTSLNPTQPVPAAIKTICIGKNIRTLGEYYRGLTENAPTIEAAFVDSQNSRLTSFSGAVYQRNGDEYQLYYIPASLKKLQLKPVKIVDKNVVFNHTSIQEVTISKGTEEISDYAFEKCPQLRVAYVPKGVKIADRAFWEVHPDFQLIRN